MHNFNLNVESNPKSILIQKLHSGENAVLQVVAFYDYKM